jgi:hypothetical protein
MQPIAAIAAVGWTIRPLVKKLWGFSSMGKYSGLIKQAQGDEPEPQAERPAPAPSDANLDTDSAEPGSKPGKYETILHSAKEHGGQSQALEPQSKPPAQPSQPSPVLPQTAAAKAAPSTTMLSQSALSQSAQSLEGLPSLSVRDRAHLPWGVTAVYAVVDPTGSVQYVGAAQNLKQRWLAHECLLSVPPESRIVYRATGRDQLEALRDSWLLYFEPRLNRHAEQQLPSRSRSITLTMPQPLYTKAESYARQRQTTIAELLTTYLEAL